MFHHEEAWRYWGILINSSKILLGSRILDPSPLLPQIQESRFPAILLLGSRGPDHSLLSNVNIGIQPLFLTPSPPCPAPAPRASLLGPGERSLESVCCGEAAEPRGCGAEEGSLRPLPASTEAQHWGREGKGPGGRRS